jgi:hypothetical protein
MHTMSHWLVIYYQVVESCHDNVFARERLKLIPVSANAAVVLIILRREESMRCVHCTIRHSTRVVLLSQTSLDETCWFGWLDVGMALEFF